MEWKIINLRKGEVEEKGKKGGLVRVAYVERTELYRVCLNTEPSAPLVQ